MANTSSGSSVAIRPSLPEDHHIIAGFLQPFMEARVLLTRTEEEIAKLAINGFLAQSDGVVVGFAAVEPYSRKLAELQCLAVAGGYRRQGIGRRLIQHCILRARELGIYELMAITSSEEPFRDCGFDYSLPLQKRALFVHPMEVDAPMYELSNPEVPSSESGDVP
jgi:amino-acid N-acetyltransferase